MDSDLLKKKEISWMWGNGRVKGKAEEKAQKFGDQVALKIQVGGINTVLSGSCGTNDPIIFPSLFASTLD